jgi:hypothetical protein
MPYHDTQLPLERSEWSFGQLLGWHLFEHGSRRDIPHSATAGLIWNLKEAARALQVTDKTLRNWLGDKNLPRETVQIEKALFGDRAEFGDWRLELRLALRTTKERLSEKRKAGAAGKRLNADPEAIDVVGPGPEIDATPLPNVEVPEQQMGAAAGGPEADESSPQTENNRGSGTALVPVEPGSPEIEDVTPVAGGSPTDQPPPSDANLPVKSDAAADTEPASPPDKPHHHGTSLVPVEPQQSEGSVPAPRSTELVIIDAKSGGQNEAGGSAPKGNGKPNPGAKSGKGKEKSSRPMGLVRFSDKTDSKKSNLKLSAIVAGLLVVLVVAVGLFGIASRPLQTEIGGPGSKPDLPGEGPTIKTKKDDKPVKVPPKPDTSLADLDQEIKRQVADSFNARADTAVSGQILATMGSSTADLCAAACLRRGDCDAYAWNKAGPQDGSNPSCTHYRAPLKFTKNPDFAAGERKPSDAAADERIKCAGRDLVIPGFSLKCDRELTGGSNPSPGPSTYIVDSAEACADKCRANTGCRAFSYDVSKSLKTNLCRLYGGRQDWAVSKGWVAGVR